MGVTRRYGHKISDTKMTDFTSLLILLLVLAILCVPCYLSARLVMKKTEVPKGKQFLIGLIAIVSFYAPTLSVVGNNLGIEIMVISVALSIFLAGYLIKKITEKYGFTAKMAAFLWLKIWGVFWMITVLPMLIFKIIIQAAKLST